MTGAFYIRTDSDHTTVVSPHVRAQKQLTEAVAVDAAYSADVWTSASVDIRASASIRPVTEQRDQLNIGVSRAWADWLLTGSYRLSLEPDYSSNGGSFALAHDLANNAAKLTVSLNVFADRVGRSGNPDFQRGVATYIANVAFTQILDRFTLLQLTYEPAHVQGYQASPYRFVGTGPNATGFGCRDADECFAERVPRGRTRHALAATLRRALCDNLSLGVAYRFYIDDWGLRSHTVQAELGVNLAQHSLLALRYRFYLQNAADFYRAHYDELLETDLRTRDRELSPMQAHRLGLELEQRIYEFDQGRTLAALLSVGGNYYHYTDFVGLKSARALELTAALMVGL